MAINSCVYIWEKWFINNVKVLHSPNVTFFGKLKIIHVHKTTVKGL